MISWIKIFLKGMLMGICDVIPGISGGTIAFITGIYERLITAVRNFSPELAYDFFRYLVKRDKITFSKLKADISALDLLFLITLGLGIGSAVLLGSKLILFLLENHFNYTISFFIGLILASSVAIYKNIKDHSLKNIVFGILGLVAGLSLAFIMPANITPTVLYVFFAGFLAISAMFLPGISGAFILLILGAYEFMLSVLHDIWNQFSYFIAFLVGAVLGALTISRVVSFLFKKDKCKTLYFLLGLVVGALSIPLKDVYQNAVWSLSSTLIMLVLVVIGVSSVMLITSFRKK